MKRLLPFLLAFLFLKIGVAVYLELGVDEAYYYTYAKKLDWSYFDHPFMVGLMAWISTFGLQWDSEFFLRLFPLIIGFFSPILVFQIARRFGNQKSALFSSFLFLATIYGSVISGLFVLPDAPLILFTLLSVYYGIRFIQENKKQWLYAFAGFLAFAIASKYQAAFVGVAMAAYILKYRPQYLRLPETYGAALIAFLGWVPTLIWNAQHQWVNFQFHSQRVGDSSLFEFFPREILGQIAYQNPIVFGLIGYALFHLKTYKNKFEPGVLWFLKCLSFPLILLALLLSIFTETLPHWSGIAYLGLIFISGKILSEMSFSLKWFYTALGLCLFTLFFGFLEVQNGWLSNALSTEKPLYLKGKGDATQDVFGWDQLATSFEKMPCLDTLETSLLVAQRWYPAGHLDYYLGRNLQKEIIAEGPLFETHQYAFKNNEKWWIKNNLQGIFIAQSNSSFRPENYYAPRFSIQPLDTLYILRKKDTVRTHFVYFMQKNE